MRLSVVVCVSVSMGALSCAAKGEEQVELPAVVVTQSPVAPKPKRPRARPRRQEPGPAREASAEEDLPAEARAAFGPGGFLSISPDASFAAVTVLSERDLSAEPAQTLGQALGHTPGISTTGFAPLASRPVIRGLSDFRVTVQENGLSTGDVASLSDDHGVPLDPGAISKVEVVRGPATLRYGSQAMGGVVYAITSRIPEAVPENGVRVETRGGYNSADKGRDGFALVEAGAGNFVIHADTFARRGDDYMTPHGRQENTRYEADGSALGVSVVGREGFLGLSYSNYASTYHIPGIEAAEEKSHIKLNQEKVASRGEFAVGAYGVEAVRAWLGATFYRHHEIVGAPVETIGSTFKNRQYEGRLEVQHLPASLWGLELRGAVGLQWTDRDLAAGGEEGLLLPRSKTQNGAVYVFEELQVARPLRLQAAARFENSDVKGAASLFPEGFLPPPDEIETAPAGKDFQAKSASVGLLYDLPFNVVGRLTGQHVERAPDATELFYRGPHEATGTFEIGSPNLTVEAADTVEVGFKKPSGRLRFDVSAYHTQFDNFIYKRFTGNKCGEEFASCASPGSPGFDPDGFDQIVFSQRSARFVGAEAISEYDVAPFWAGVFGVQAQYDFVRATFEDGSFVPKIPPHRLGGGVYYYDRHVLARLTLLHAFEQNEFADFDTPTPGYNLLNAEISYTTKIDGSLGLAGLVPQMTLGFKATNLLNEDIRNATSYKKDEVLEPGRSVRLFGSFKLN